MNIMNSFTLECSFFGKEWKSQTESLSNTQKKKLTHMSIGDYNSLGLTLIKVMKCYLPSEQSKLQFISGKILDVFYDEFIKFIPPYILKKEEEKRKKAEREALSKGQPVGQSSTQSQAIAKRLQKATQMQNNGQRGQDNTRRAPGVQKNRKDSQRRASEILTGRQRNAFIGDNNEDTGYSEYNRQADRSAATKKKVANIGIDGEESSDHKQIHGLSSKDDTDQFNSIMNIPSNQNDIMDFDNFMNGIQNNLKEKEDRQKKKLEGLLDNIVKKGTLDEESKAKIRMDLLVSSDDSSNSSGDDVSPQARQKKKLKMQKKQKMLEKMIKKAEEKIKKKKQQEEKKIEESKKDETKKEERKNKTPSKAIVTKKKESKLGIFNTQAATVNATPDLTQTANFVGKKKSKAPPKEDQQQTIQSNYKYSSFNTSVLNQVNKNEALITRSKYTNSKMVPNEEPSIQGAFYQGSALTNNSGRISNFDLNAHEIMKGPQTQEMLVRENSVNQFNESPRHPSKARDFIISGSSTNKKQLNFIRAQQNHEPRKLGTAGDGQTRPSEVQSTIKEQAHSSQKQFNLNDGNQLKDINQNSHKTMKKIDLVQNQSFQRLRGNTNNVLKGKRQNAPLHQNIKQNPMMSGVSITQVHQMNPQFKTENDSHEMMEKMQQDLMIKGKKGMDPFFQQVGISGHSIPMNLGKQATNSKKSPQISQKIPNINKSPIKIGGTSTTASKSKNASINNYNEIIAKVRMNRIVQSSDTRGNHGNDPYIQQQIRTNLIDSRSDKDINITYNSQQFRQSAEPTSQKVYIKQQSKNRNSVQTGLQLQKGKNIGQSSLNSQKSLHGNVQQPPGSTHLTPNQVSKAIRQEQNKQTMMMDLMRQLNDQNNSNQKKVVKPKYQQQLLFNNIQQQINDGSYGFNDDNKATELQRNMLIHFISQHYQNSQVMHKRQGNNSAYREETIGQGSSRLPSREQKRQQTFMAIQASTESPQQSRFAGQGAPSIEDYFQRQPSVPIDGYTPAQFSSINSRKSAYDSPEIIKGKVIALESKNIKMDMSADQGYKSKKIPSRFSKVQYN